MVLLRGCGGRGGTPSTSPHTMHWGTEETGRGDLGRDSLSLQGKRSLWAGQSWGDSWDGVGGPLGTPSRQDAACGTGNKTRDVGLRGMCFLFRQTQLLNLTGNAGRKEGWMEGDQAEQPLGTPSWVGPGHTGSHTPTVISGRKVGPSNPPSTLFLPCHLSWRSLRQVGWGWGQEEEEEEEARPA